MCQNKKMQSCKYCHTDIMKLMKKENDCHYCFKRDTNGTILEKPDYDNENPFLVNDEICENCNAFKSKYIEYPLTINNIDTTSWKNVYENAKKEMGTLVKVRPCDEKYNNKTYLGFLLGDLPLSPNIFYQEKSQELSISPFTNPCIFIPELKTIVWGMESWWSKIEKEEDLKEITNEDINKVWYVELFKNIRK